LFRLLGADGVIFVNHGGRFGTPPATCRALANNLRQPWGHLLPALPIPAGGMTTARVPEMIDFYGEEVALLISGALYPADEHLESRAAAFVSAACAQSSS
ncbi:MAG: ribulose 1,5-bisphosphate carboxylase, partial [Caldilineaceae bacterium]